MTEFKDSQRVIFRPNGDSLAVSGTIIGETAPGFYDLEIDHGGLVEASRAELTAMCATCSVGITPSGKYEGSWEDECGSAFGPDHGEGQRPHGMVHYHRHYPHAKIVRQDQLKFLSPRGGKCEACHHDMPSHGWVAMDVNGFVLWCDRNPKGKE